MDHTDDAQRTTGEALDWLRETDSLSEKTIERALSDDLSVTETEPGTHTVRNNSYDNPSEHEYTVDVAGSIPTTCSCPHYEYRNEICKHMIAVALSFTDRDS